MSENYCVTKQSLMKKINCMKEVYENPKTHYSVWARVIEKNFKEQVALVLRDNAGLISDPIMIGRDEAIAQDSKAITKELKNCIGGLGEISSINAIGKYLRENFDKLPKIALGERETSIDAYNTFFEEAITSPALDEIYLDQNQNCNILAKKFNEIKDRLVLEINRKKFINDMKLFDLLIHNEGRNEVSVTSSDGSAQLRMICLKAIASNEETPVCEDEELITMKNDQQAGGDFQ
ncbi:MAG: hypothetical protein ACYDEX_11070 [Mobilitalea sp.]